MIGTRMLGKPNSETFCSEHLRKTRQKKATITEITDKTEEDAVANENEVVKSTTVENSGEDKTSSDNVTPFFLDVSDNAYILTPPPMGSLHKTPELPPIVVGYNTRKDTTYALNQDLTVIMIFECLTQLLLRLSVKLNLQQLRSNESSGYLTQVVPIKRQHS